MRRIGVLFRTDSRRVIKNSTNPTFIKPPWDKCIADARDAYVDILGHDLIHSIYVRGSVATGSAVPHVADIDMVAVTTIPVGKNKKDKLGRARHRLGCLCRIAQKYELPVVFIDSLLEDDRYYHWRFTLKTQGVCVYGMDIIPALPDFRLTRQTLARLLEPIDRYINNIKSLFDSDVQKVAVVRARCSWIMKKLVRQAGLLVMEQEGIFTRSLYHCYEMVAKHHPQRKAAMWKAMVLALNPTANKRAILRVLDSLGPWLQEETKCYIEAGKGFARAA